MNSIRRNFIFTLSLTALFVFVLPNAIVAAEKEITHALKRTIKQVVEIVYDDDLKRNPDTRRVLLQRAINQQFNFNQMGARALAENWNARSAKERRAFILRFRNLLERSYVQRIESYEGGKIRFTDEVVKGKYAIVKTRIEMKRKSIDFDYKMIRENGQWKVYDILDQGVSIIRNYRHQLASTLKNESFSDLLKKMDKSKEGGHSVQVAWRTGSY
ncbi:MAG: toluene tolerance protein [Nitrospinaceae bacterium]|nr:MAG: toluene tolerance protein [Nitrospinaceae bacterium]